MGLFTKMVDRRIRNSVIGSVSEYRLKFEKVYRVPSLIYKTKKSKSKDKE